MGIVEECAHNILYVFDAMWGKKLEESIRASCEVCSYLIGMCLWEECCGLVKVEC